MKKTTRQWIKKAEQDYALAVHCQQCAEKYLKALMEERGISTPKTHALVLLLAALISNYPRLRSFRRGLAFLTPFAVEIRYPGDNATKRQAVAALRWAGKLREKARDLLGIR
jgi:HEPN domain-containing protein